MTDSLFIRDVPPDVFALLDAEVARLRASDTLRRRLSRPTLALKLLTDALEATRAKP